MTDKLTNPAWVIVSDWKEVLKELWDNRYRIPVGNVSSVSHGFSISVMRLSEHEFCLIMSSSLREMHDSQDIMGGILAND